MTDDSDMDKVRQRNAQLEHEAILRAALAVERAVSNGMYAAKIVERIVFGFMAAVALGVLGAVLALVLR